MKAKAALLMIPMFIFSAMLAGAPVSAQETGTADAQKSEDQAMAVMKHMADYLSQAKRFSVTIDTGFDAVQEFGQKIEFGEIRKVVLSRPDRLRVDATKRDGSKSEMIFDGKDIALYFSKNARVQWRLFGHGPQPVAVEVHGVGPDVMVGVFVERGFAGIELISQRRQAVHGGADVLHAAGPITAVACRHGVDQCGAHGGQRRRHLRPEHRAQLVEPRRNVLERQRDLRFVLVCHGDARLQAIRQLCKG